MAGAGSGYGLFFREFLRNFHTTGAVLPSGPWLSRALARYVDGNGRPQRILEVGPGTGVVTRQIVPRMGPEDRLDLVELNSSFVARLQTDLEHDPVLRTTSNRIAVHEIAIENLGHERQYDVIVSGLPLNNFSAELVEKILAEFAALLAPGGTLSFFEYIAIRRLKSAISGGDQRQRLRQIDAILSRLLDAHEIRRDCILANVLPAWVHHVRFT